MHVRQSVTNDRLILRSAFASNKRFDDWKKGCIRLQRFDDVESSYAAHQARFIDSEGGRPSVVLQERPVIQKRSLR